MRVTLLAYTLFSDEGAHAASDGAWTTPGDAQGSWRNEANASLLSEFAGRECYQSWTRPNPATATNRGYIGNIMKQQHMSVIEHGSVSFRIQGVSRSLTHELVRHRHFSYSQLSQRYVDKLPDEPVVPPLFRDAVGEEADAVRLVLRDLWNATREAYEEFIKAGEAFGATHKEARQAARAVLPNMTPTSLVMTGNHRSWLEFLQKRGSRHADVEIRELAVRIFEVLRDLEPSIYQNMFNDGKN